MPVPHSSVKPIVLISFYPGSHGDDPTISQPELSSPAILHLGRTIYDVFPLSLCLEVGEKCT